MGNVLRTVFIHLGRLYCGAVNQENFGGVHDAIGYSFTIREQEL